METLTMRKVFVKRHQRRIPSGGKTTVRRHQRRISSGSPSFLGTTKTLSASEFLVQKIASEGYPTDNLIAAHLEYKVYRYSTDWVIKEPNPGFGFKVPFDAKRLEELGDIAPKTHYIKDRNVLLQRYIQGREATDDEVKQISLKIRERGYIPRGILPRDVIVDKYGKSWVVDVGNFASRKYEEETKGWN